ncbi:receptor like protein kinase S.2-like [Bidens hawaiensis]|uniref:receptor like protein kinase S.2-like n=1 Tax=Bidens hawaiensis TaxID=980011 RepID=UPI004049A552
MDPAYENTQGVTHKSDVFSFGVLLFEILFGREASIQNNDNWYFARLARSHYEERKLDDLINPDLRKQMNLQSLNIFAEMAYHCLKEKRSERPDMNHVDAKLKEALELQHKHEQPIITDAVGGTSASNRYHGKSLDHLKYRSTDIESATHGFSETCCIGSGGYGKVYKAELYHHDGINSLRVAIKRISSREDKLGEQGFIAEIEMLSKCKHPNIVSLQGFCDEGAEMILIYEYVSNGSLADYFTNTKTVINLTWTQRIQICLDIANGLNYLHTCTDDKQVIVHRDIKSDNILLDDKWVAKIADFGLGRLRHASQQGSTLITKNIAGTDEYLDPEYMKTGKLNTKSDVYSFGVVMLEIMCGKLAYDKIYDKKGLPSIARLLFNKGALTGLIDPKIMEADENISILIGGVNQDSLDTFTNIAHECLAETQSKRPTMEVVIMELTKALDFQKNSKDNLRVSLQDIKFGTQNFNDCNCIGEGRFWKLYTGTVGDANGLTTVFIKRWDVSRQGYYQFLNELKVLVKYKHKNIIGIVGYCNEENENIIVYEHASNGRLDKHLCDPSLTWMRRLKICLDVAKGLEFIHRGLEGDENGLTHSDVKSGRVLLNCEWNAKISNFEMSSNTTLAADNRAEYVKDNACYSLGYVDPMYRKDGLVKPQIDIYSLGVILLEMLCGKLAWLKECKDHSQSLGPLQNLDLIVFKAIKEQIAPRSLTTFVNIALECLKQFWAERPKIEDAVIQLERALEFQEDFDIWDAKLPKDYNEIIRKSKTPVDSIEKKKDIYDMLSKGILLQDGNVVN